MRGQPFNTDYWTFSNQFMAGAPQVTMDQPGDTTNSGLPALWWLGGLIILVAIRVAYELMD